jgi:prevent-host-death family protein
MEYLEGVHHKNNGNIGIQAHALQVLGEVAKRKESVLVTKRGKPFAAVVPYTEPEPAAGRLAEAFVFELDIVTPFGAKAWDACR